MLPFIVPEVLFAERNTSRGISPFGSVAARKSCNVTSSPRDQIRRLAIEPGR